MFNFLKSNSTSSRRQSTITPSNISEEEFNKIKKQLDEYKKLFLDQSDKNKELKEKLFILSTKEKINSSDQVDAEVWDLYVSEGVYGAIRGDYSKITEIYIPSWSVALNYVYRDLNIVSYDNIASRYSNENKMHTQPPCKLIKKITLSNELTSLFKKIVESNNTLKINKVHAVDEFKKLISNFEEPSEEDINYDECEKIVEKIQKQEKEQAHVESHSQS